MNRSDAANRLERLLRRDLQEAAREAGPPSGEEIDAYVAGRASAAEREVIENWLADDPALQAEVEAVMAMRQAIEGESAEPIPREESEVRRQMRARPMRAVALIALAASLAFVTLWVASPGRPPVTSDVATSDSRPSSAAPARGDTPAGTQSPKTEAAPAVTLTLRDTSGEVSLLANGAISGLDGIDASARSAVARALASGRLDMTPQVDTLAGSAGVLRAPGDVGTAPALRVVRPLATVVRSARPTFEWTPLPGASSYRVRVADSALNHVAESPILTTTAWTPETALPSGRVLMWQVEAQTPQGRPRPKRASES
jgi:hypothetical protein